MKMGGRLGGTRAHLEDGDLDGDDGARLVLGPGVVLLAEHHDVHTLGKEEGAGRTGRSALEIRSCLRVRYGEAKKAKRVRVSARRETRARGRRDGDAPQTRGEGVGIPIRHPTRARTARSSGRVIVASASPGTFPPPAFRPLRSPDQRTGGKRRKNLTLAPSAGPMGGAGFALPASMASLM